MRRHASPLRAVLAAGMSAFACLAAAGTAPTPAPNPAQGIGPPASAAYKLTDEERTILCLDLKSLAPLREETATLNDMSARLLRMQATVTEVRALIEAMPADRPAAAAPLPVATPDGAAPPPVTPPPVAAASVPPPAAPQDLPWMQIAAGGGVLALLGLLWALRRQAAAAPTSAAATPSPNIKAAETTIAEPLPAAPLPAGNTGPSPGISQAIRAAAVALDTEPEFLPAPPPGIAPPFEPAASSADSAGPGEPVELPEVDQALELAEVMVSMGLTQAAADTLVDHIRAHPRRTLYHWLKLLDIYKTSGKKEDFEQSAIELRRNFNIQANDWQAAKGAPARSIEDYGHICTRIQELWGRSGCVDYMARLLEDNRGGARLGFPQSVAEDILLLIAILRDGGETVGA